jgi:hypothetical protein
VVLRRLTRFARKSPSEQLRIARRTLLWYFIERGLVVPHVGNDRTAYVVGLFGSGRHYVNELIVGNIGERAKYFRDVVDFRFHSGPTSMIYSGHATMRHDCRGQSPPAETGRILEAVASGFADLIFVNRHPLDSLLTNWIWFRKLDRENQVASGISQIYKNTDDLCADLDKNFLDFKAFAEGHQDFFAFLPNRPFLSFTEFLEETELFLKHATLTVRLEDFMTNPSKEFSRIADVMGVKLDLRGLHLNPPTTKPYRYLVVSENVARFKEFVDGLPADTRTRFERIGYVAAG